MHRHQRERLLAATVAVVAKRGYQETRVEDILRTAGVSRNAFYKQFSNKRGCFVATLEGISDFASAAVLAVFEQTPGPWDRKLAAMLDAFAATIAAQPETARVAWVEVYAAGPEAMEVIERLDRATEDIVCRALKDSPERAGLPREIVRAVIGGVRNIVRTLVREQRTDELPAMMPRLFEWMQSYHTPPERLRRPRRVPPELVAPRPAPIDARERILASVTDLVAEKGYPEMAITDIAARASVSLTTFYAHFDGKEAAFLAARDDAQRRLLAATVAHAVHESDWANSLNTGWRAFLAFLATDPLRARFGGVGVWATSAAGLELRAQGMDSFSALLAEGRRRYPATNPVVELAIGPTLDALLFNALRRGGAERLYEIAPTGTFIALAPFLGTERACELANSPSVAIGQTTL